MRLWLTRDEDATIRPLLWIARAAPVIVDGQWTYSGCEELADETFADIPPGTCTELFTEREVALFVARAMITASGERMILARDWLNDPSDENTRRLMAEVGGGE